MSVPPAKKVEIPQQVLDLIHDDEELFRSMPPQEMAKYGGKWIATKSKQVVAAAGTLGELYRQPLQEPRAGTQTSRRAWPSAGRVSLHYGGHCPGAL